MDLKKLYLNTKIRSNAFHLRGYWRLFKCNFTPIRRAAITFSALTFPVIFFSEKTFSNTDIESAPPQFVLFAFDGSKSLNMWQESREFARVLNTTILKDRPSSEKFKFTYFVSGVYFLSPQTKTLYKAPYRSQGSSAIGFSNSSDEIVPRLDEMSSAYKEGHEIGSHANGHFDASDIDHFRSSQYHPWTMEDWISEFTQFNKLIFSAYSNNILSTSSAYPNGLLFTKKDIVGFRAPVLGVTPGLWPTLKKFDYKYDTSKVNNMKYWPTKDSQGVWQLPLAELVIAGTGKKTLSMDYNFYVTQSKGNENMYNSNNNLKEEFQKQMYNTYLNYFLTNYNGNRAPVQIGHHFSKWNGGAYWSAMKQFALKVCGLPQVRCSTFAEYVQWLESQNPQVLAEYKKGKYGNDFQSVDFLNNEKDASLYPLELQVHLEQKGGRAYLITEGKDWTPEKYKAIITVEGQAWDRDNDFISLSEIKEKYSNQDVITVATKIVDMNNSEMDAKSYFLKIQKGKGTFILERDPQEVRVLLGDLPEAHFDEE